MARFQFQSPQTPEQLTRSIMTLCPGGAVGVVMKQQGRLLLPRRMSAGQVVIERRKPGAPSGRIVVTFSPTGTGTAVEIASGVHPTASAISAGAILVLAFVVARVVGAGAGVLVGGTLAAFEALRWRRGLAGASADAAWLAERLQHQPA